MRITDIVVQIRSGLNAFKSKNSKPKPEYIEG